MYKASDIKDLRERTGAGMLDCKKALEACNGDMEKSIDWLNREFFFNNIYFFFKFI